MIWMLLLLLVLMVVDPDDLILGAPFRAVVNVYKYITKPFTGILLEYSSGLVAMGYIAVFIVIITYHCNYFSYLSICLPLVLEHKRRMLHSNYYV